MDSSISGSRIKKKMISSSTDMYSGWDSYRIMEILRKEVSNLETKTLERKNLYEEKYDDKSLRSQLIDSINRLTADELLTEHLDSMNYLNDLDSMRRHLLEKRELVVREKLEELLNKTKEIHTRIFTMYIGFPPRKKFTPPPRIK